MAVIVKSMGLDKCLIVRHSGREPSSAWTLATLLEAILGAVYLDSGNDPETVRRIMHRIGLSYAEYQRTHETASKAIRSAEKVQRRKAEGRPRVLRPQRQQKVQKVQKAHPSQKLHLTRSEFKIKGLATFGRGLASSTSTSDRPRISALAGVNAKGSTQKGFLRRIWEAIFGA